VSLPITLATAGLVCAICMGLPASFDVGAQSAGAAPPRSVWDGVFTVDQARRGEALYDSHCASCHQFGLEGDGLDVPGLTGPEFRQKWDRRTLMGLFSLVSMSMPQQAPGSLTPSEYVDIIGYILEKNAFPSGQRPLTVVPAELEGVSLEGRRSP